MTGRLRDTISKFNQIGTTTEAKLVHNPFSDNYTPRQHKLTDERYGRPEAGSLTEKRGIKAGNYVSREIIFLCEIISKYAQQVMRETGEIVSEIKFGYLFNLYATYSDKVVGMLLRARKYNLVHFEGEMLYQGQNDNTVITLLKPLSEIRESMKQSNDPKSCLAVAGSSRGIHSS